MIVCLSLNILPQQMTHEVITSIIPFMLFQAQAHGILVRQPSQNFHQLAFPQKHPADAALFLSIINIGLSYIRWLEEQNNLIQLKRTNCALPGQKMVLRFDVSKNSTCFHSCAIEFTLFTGKMTYFL